MPTTAFQAYQDGVEARKNHPNTDTWYGILPYAVIPLTWAWIDGWYGVQVDWDETCHYCYNRAITLLPDGIRRCKIYPCRKNNYPPDDWEKAKDFQAYLNLGAYI